jgi:hypothetical protein
MRGYRAFGFVFCLGSIKGFMKKSWISFAIFFMPSV